METTIETRTCKDCQRELPIDEYRKTGSPPTTRRICRECQNKRNRARYEERKHAETKLQEVQKHLVKEVRVNLGLDSNFDLSERAKLGRDILLEALKNPNLANNDVVKLATDCLTAAEVVLTLTTRLLEPGDA